MNSVHNPSCSTPFSSGKPIWVQPENGPRILFFSGGSAINAFSSALTRHTHRSIHLVTPFDSGGSSANLRTSFAMPSVGDLRSRLVALADDQPAHQAIKTLFDRRLSQPGSPSRLLEQLNRLSQGDAPEFNDMHPETRECIVDHLACFLREMPESFDLEGASIGNLILAGGYLQSDGQLQPVIERYSRLMNALGTVAISSDEHLHLVADLEDGTRLFGQHRLTGKTVAPITQPIRRLWLSTHPDRFLPAHPPTSKRIRQLILSADLICYPPGSFYTSLLANLLPLGIRQAISENPCSKVYIPNLGKDPEQLGKRSQQLLNTLVAQLEDGLIEPRHPCLTHILMDSHNGDYPGGLQSHWLQQRQIQLEDKPLIHRAHAPFYDNELLIEALMTLAGNPTEQ